VKITTYIDESGSHDKTGKLPGAGQIVVCGWVDWSDNWDKFCKKWKSILDKYGAAYFHFTEWADASAVARNIKVPSASFSKNPYDGWNVEKLDNFLYELAEIAGGGQKISVGGYVSTHDFHEAKQHPDYSHHAPKHGDPYKQCLNIFFESFSREVQEQWPYWTEPVSFVFDQTDNAEWRSAVNVAFEAVKNRDSRIAELIFSDKKLYQNLPLQAADMLAYRTRQITEKFLNPDVIPNPSKLDDLLFKPNMSRATPQYILGAISDSLAAMPLRQGNFPWRKKT
jgi:hypothetical protein